MSVTVEITVNTAYPTPAAVSRSAPGLVCRAAAAVTLLVGWGGSTAPGVAQTPPPVAATDSAPTFAAPVPRADTLRISAMSAAVLPAPSDSGEHALPPTEHPFDVWDALGLPLRVVTAPLAALGIAVREGLRLVAPGSGSPGSPAASGPLGSRLLAGSVGPRSGPAVGLRVEEPAPAWGEVMASVRGSWRAAGGLPSTAVSEFGIQLAIERHAEPHFWGIGPDSRPDDRADFGWRRWEATGTLESPAAAAVRVSAGLEGSRTGRGADDAVRDLVDRVEPEGLSGLGRAFRHVRLGVGLRAGGVRWTGLRARGIRARLDGDLYVGLSGAPDFAILRGTVSGELPAGPQRGLALFLRGALAEPFGGDELPFTHLPALGGDLGARGFDGDRFRDRALLAAGGEWRWELWRTIHEDTAVEVFLFLESGTVASRLEALSAGKLRTSWGGGFRLVTLEGLRAFGALGVGERARLDAGVSWAF